MLQLSTHTTIADEATPLKAAPIEILNEDQLTLLGSRKMVTHVLVIVIPIYIRNVSCVHRHIRNAGVIQLTTRLSHMAAFGIVPIRTKRTVNVKKQSHAHTHIR